MDLSIDFNCPDCGSTVNVSMADVARERTVRCRNGHAVRLKDGGGGARKAGKAMQDLDKAIRRLGR